jgi:ATP-dependent Lon protease
MFKRIFKKLRYIVLVCLSSSMLATLRSGTTYRPIVDEIVEMLGAADLHDTEVVKRITTAYLKLLFPNGRNKVAW